MLIGSYEKIPIIMDQILKESPQSILDIGDGFGKYGDILELVDNLQNYDVIIFIDVLEHFEKELGKILLNKLIKHVNKSLIVSTQVYLSGEKEYLCNGYEENKSKWSLIDFIDFDFSYKLLPIEQDAAGILNIFPVEKIETIKKSEEEFVGMHCKEKLTIAYLLSVFRYLTGGTKILLEQMRYLHNRGHKIMCFCVISEEDEVFPQWFNEYDKNYIDELVIIHNDTLVEQYIDKCDVVIAGWIYEIPKLLNCHVPIVYLEQGSEEIFGDINDLDYDSDIRKKLLKIYNLPCNIISVSNTVAIILTARFNKKTEVIPNGIDTEFYYPSKRPNNNTILLVGNPLLKFKCFDIALKTLQKVWNMGYRFNVNWVCQQEPQVQGVGFPIKFILNPSQQNLAECYRNSDVFLFTSLYEGFGMPPLEAMASGVPVVATKCGGINSYAEEGSNALLADPYDIDSLAFAVIHLLENEASREILAQRGRETALKFDFTNTIINLEQYLIKAVSNYSMYDS